MATSSASAAPPWAGRTLSPMLRQYVQAKEENPDVILMFRMGDFFELFFDDAKLAAELLDLTLTARDKGEHPVPMAGVPHHAIDGYVARLVAQGHSVALCDQIEDPKATKGLVRRAITRLVTPGTICELDALDPGQSSYLAAVLALPSAAAGDAVGDAGDAGNTVGLDAAAAADASQAPRSALAFLDLLAGELAITVVPQADAAEELLRMGAREVLLADDAPAALRETLRRRQLALRPTLAGRVRPAAPAAPAAAAAAAATPAIGTSLPAAPALPAAATKELDAAAQAGLRRAMQEVLAWASHTQRRALGHVGQPRYYRLEGALVLDEATRQNLELLHTQMGRQRQGSLLGHLDRCRTPMGSRLLRRWLLAPLRNQATIARRADVVEALVRHEDARAQIRATLAEVRDIERLAGRVALGRATPRDLLALACSLLQLPALAVQVQALAPQLADVLADAWRRAPDLQPHAAALRAAFVDQPPTPVHDGGIFRRGYNAALDELLTLTEDADAWLQDFAERERTRSGIGGLKVRYNRVFGYNIEVSRALGAKVPADYVRRQTLANAERYVTDELKQFEVRALSAAGERKAHEAALFAQLLEDWQLRLPALKAVARLVAQTDALSTLAEVAERHRYVRPQLTDAAELTLVGSRHPVLETLLPQGERFVANDVACDTARHQLTVLTGPNMAGKSTLMRQVALSVIMAQMGGYVPAGRACVGLVDRLFVRVGASDNLSRGQSTFMVEMVETATILRQATSRSLILLDEIGRGTSTFDGLSIAWAVAEYLHDHIGARTLFATHYHELVALTDGLPRARAMQVTVHEQDGQLVFLRQLKEGAAMRSYGIEVARLAAVPDPVLRRARTILAALEAGGSEPPAGADDPGARPDAGPGGADAAPGAALPHVALPCRKQLSLFAARDLPPPPPARAPAAQSPWPAAAATTQVPALPVSPAARRADRALRRLLAVNLDALTPLAAHRLLQRLQQQHRAATRPEGGSGEGAHAGPAAAPGGKTAAGRQKTARARMHQGQLLP